MWSRCVGLWLLLRLEQLEGATIARDDSREAGSDSLSADVAADGRVDTVIKVSGKAHERPTLIRSNAWLDEHEREVEDQSEAAAIKSPACILHNFTVRSDNVGFLFEAKLTDSTGRRAVRMNAVSPAAVGDVRLFFEDGKLHFVIIGSAPQGQTFRYAFATENTYDIQVIYSKPCARVSLYMDGKFMESLGYNSAVSADIRPGYLGCRKVQGAGDEQFAGEIDDFRIKSAEEYRTCHDPPELVSGHPSHSDLSTTQPSTSRGSGSSIAGQG